LRELVTQLEADRLRGLLAAIAQHGRSSDDARQAAIEALTLLNDRRFDTGALKRSSLLQMVRAEIDALLASVPAIAEESSSRFARLDFAARAALRAPREQETTLVIDAESFQPEGDDCDALLIVAAYRLGWRRFIVHRYRGQRFTGCGLGPGTHRRL
jgi:hypothetical protein